MCYSKHRIYSHNANGGKVPCPHSPRTTRVRRLLFFCHGFPKTSEHARTDCNSLYHKNMSTSPSATNSCSISETSAAIQQAFTVPDRKTTTSSPAARFRNCDLLHHVWQRPWSNSQPPRAWSAELPSNLCAPPSATCPSHRSPARLLDQEPDEKRLGSSLNGNIQYPKRFLKRMGPACAAEARNNFLGAIEPQTCFGL